MRMWMIPALYLCRNHLLGEHVETHMFLGSLLRGKSLRGFFEKGLLEPGSLLSRHDALVREMGRRGYTHRSPMDPTQVAEVLIRLSPDDQVRRVDRSKAAADVATRCEACRGMLLGSGKGLQQLQRGAESS